MAKYSQCYKPVIIANFPSVQHFFSKPETNSLITLCKNIFYPNSRNNIVTKENKRITCYTRWNIQYVTVRKCMYNTNTESFKIFWKILLMIIRHTQWEKIKTLSFSSFSTATAKKLTYIYIKFTIIFYNIWTTII